MNTPVSAPATWPMVPPTVAWTPEKMLAETAWAVQLFLAKRTIDIAAILRTQDGMGRLLAWLSQRPDQSMLVALLQHGRWCDSLLAAVARHAVVDDIDDALWAALRHDNEVGKHLATNTSLSVALQEDLFRSVGNWMAENAHSEEAPLLATGKALLDRGEIGPNVVLEAIARRPRIGLIRLLITHPTTRKWPEVRRALAGCGAAAQTELLESSDDPEEGLRLARMLSTSAPVRLLGYLERQHPIVEKLPRVAWRDLLLSSDGSIRQRAARALSQIRAGSTVGEEAEPSAVERPESPRRAIGV